MVGLMPCMGPPVPLAISLRIVGMGSFGIIERIGGEAIERDDDDFAALRQGKYGKDEQEGYEGEFFHDPRQLYA